MSHRYCGVAIASVGICFCVSTPNLPLCVPYREVAQIDQFLQETAAREANAKVRLQQFIEELLDRADRAEKQLQIISSCGTTPNGSLGRCSVQESKGNGRQVWRRVEVL